MTYSSAAHVRIASDDQSTESKTPPFSYQEVPLDRMVGCRQRRALQQERLKTKFACRPKWTSNSRFLFPQSFSTLDSFPRFLFVEKLSRVQITSQVRAFSLSPSRRSEVYRSTHRLESSPHSRPSCAIRGSTSHSPTSRLLFLVRQIP